MDILYRNIAPGALHNAAERSDPPKCHLETRLEIRTEIITWIVEPGVRKTFILWIYGPAGSGKTAIQLTIAELCNEMGILAASFFSHAPESGVTTPLGLSQRWLINFVSRSKLYESPFCAS